MTGDSDDVELRHKSGESLELQAATAQQSTTVVVSENTCARISQINFNINFVSPHKDKKYESR